MQFGRHTWQWGALLGIVTVAALLFWALRPAEKLLLEKATRLGKTSAFFCDNHQYFWLSGDEVLKIQASSEEGKLESIRLNATTGKAELLPGLGSVLQPCVKQDHLFYPRLSPDRQWLLVLSGCGSVSNADHIAVKLDGSKSYSWAKPLEGMAVEWLPDSRRWVQFVFRDGQLAARIYSLDTPDISERTIGAPRLSAVLGFVSDHIALVEYADPSGGLPMHGYPDLTFARLNLAAFAQEGAPSRLIAPRNGGILEVCLSPEGDRLAWLFLEQATMPHIHFSKQFPFAQTWPRELRRLCVSKTDGSEMREIGRLKESATSKPLGDIASLHWLPDGKRVSFVYQNTLWTVPVD